MATFDNLKQLEAYVNKAMMDAMKLEVSEKVKDIQAEKVKTEVYDRYTSQTPYIPRRNGNDGLADKKNMKSTVTQDINGVSLEVKNEAKGNPNVENTGATIAPDYLAGIIEYGRLPGRKGRYTRNATGTQDEYLQARPFTKATEDTLLQTGEHVNAMKQGLKRQGIDVE
jgi:hypothetical protein